MLLFDIDDTLVAGSSINHHKDSFSVAIKQIYGLKTRIENIDYHGMTDQQVIMELLAQLGVDRSAAEAQLQNCLAVMTEYYLSIPSHQTKVLPGVEKLLKELQSRGHLMGLVTGNLEAIAYTKLRGVGLDRFFPFGGFGSDHAYRPRLTEIAVERARKYRPRNSTAYLFDDAVRGCLAAQEAGAKVIGVATGSYSEKTLKKAGIKQTVPDLTDPARILKIIGTPA